MDNFSQNPYLLYAMLNKQQGNHYFNQAMGYNPYFTGSYANDYNSFANIEYLKPQYSNYNFGLKDVLLTHMGFHRKLGMNGMDADIAAHSEHALTLNNLGITAGATAMQVAALGLGGPAGLVAGAAIDWAKNKYIGNRDSTYKLMQKANILTNNMVQNGRFDTGLSSDELKGIEKHARKLSVKDDFFSSSDIMDMMNQFNKSGMLNDVSSATQFKQTMTTLKNRVKDLAEFLGETKPSKLFQDLSRYRFLGFSRGQSFNIMKSMDVAADLSGMNMKTLEKTIGMISTSQNPLGIDTRTLTRQGITVANGLNTLQRMPGSYTFMSNSQQALTNMLQTNTQSEQALHHYFNQDSNKDIFLAKYMSKDNGLSTQKNLDKILKMSIAERNKYVSKYSKSSDFSQVYNDPTLLSTAVKEMKGVGGLHTDRLAIQRLIDMAIKSSPNGTRTDYDRMLQKMGGFSSDQMLYVDKLVNNRMKFGGWSFMDDMQKVANSKIKTKEAYNTLKKYDNQSSIRYKLATAYRGTTNWLAEEWGGSTGEDVASDTIDYANSFKQKVYNEKYDYYQNASKFYSETHSKNYRDYLTKIKEYVGKSKGTEDTKNIHNELKEKFDKSMQKKKDHLGLVSDFFGYGSKLNDINIRENAYNYQGSNLNKDLYAARELAKNSVMYKYVGKELEYQAQKQVLGKEIHNNADYFHRLYKLRSKYHGSEKNNFGFNADMLKDKRLGKFITNKGQLGEFQARAIEQYGIMTHNGGNFSKEDFKILSEKMPVTSAYYKWKNSGSEGSFVEYAKKHKIKFNTNDLVFAKEIYKKHANRANQYINFTQALKDGNISGAKNIIDDGLIDGEDVEKAVKLSSLDASDKKHILATLVSRDTHILGKFKGHKNELSQLKQFSSSIDNIKDKRLRDKLSKATGDKFFNLLKNSDSISNPEKRRLTNEYMEASKIAKDRGIEQEDIYKTGEAGLSSDAKKVFNNLKDLYGLNNESNSAVFNAINQDDPKAFKRINELRKKENEKALTYSQFKSVQNLSNVGTTLGLDAKGMKEIQKYNSLSSTDKTSSMVKNLKDINRKADEIVKVLTEIKDQ